MTPAQKAILTLVCLYSAGAFAAALETKAETKDVSPGSLNSLELLGYCSQMTTADPLVTPTNRFYDRTFQTTKQGVRS